MSYARHLPTLFIPLLLAALSCGVQAATVSFALDQSNALPDGVDYLVVTLSDDVEGQLDFWVDVQSPLTDIAGENFGIQKFTFSIAGDMQSDAGHGHGSRGNEPPGLDVAAEHRAHGESEAHRHEIEHEWGGEGHGGAGQCCTLDSMLTADAFILPEGWKVQFGKGGWHEEDGFSIRLLGTGNSRQDPLHFSVLGLTLEDVLAGFSAHVAGFEYITGECGAGEHQGEHGCGIITSAWFYGERPVVIPLPAAAWLFGSGLLGMAAVARRRQRSA